MNTPSVSFIIPYHLEDIALLQRAVASVAQIGDEADWEMWVVDDGTSSKQVECFVRDLADERIHYHLQSHGGLGKARNTGMELARKEYIQFLDADDFLCVEAERLMLRLLAKEHPDVLAFDFRKVDDSAPHAHDLPASPHIIYKGDGPNFMLRHNLRGSAWGYIFARDAVGTLQFTPGIYHEDEEFTPLLFLRAQSIVITDLPVYAYFQRTNSIVHTSNRFVVAKRFADVLAIIGRLDARCKTLQGTAMKALRRRVDQLRMDMLFTLLCDAPDQAFIKQNLHLMKQAGYYPIAVRPYTIPYLVLCLCNFMPFALFASWLIQRLHLSHAGRASGRSKR